jgi:hypothetical protein
VQSPREMNCSKTKNANGLRLQDSSRALASWRETNPFKTGRSAAKDIRARGGVSVVPKLQQEDREPAEDGAGADHDDNHVY